MSAHEAEMPAHIDHHTAARSVVEMDFVRRTVQRDHAFVRLFTLDEPVAAVSLLGEHDIVDRSVTDESGVSVLAGGRSGSVLIAATTSRTWVTVACSTEQEARTLEAAIRARCPVETAESDVSIRTWNVTTKGLYVSRDRAIDAPNWSSISLGYAPAVRRQLDELMAVEAPSENGKLILWHGEPGTGKTTALRALMKQWEPWCASQYISDPERFFVDPGYIMEVLTRPVRRTHGPTLDTPGAANTRWSLVIAEDCDEYVRASARRDAGGALGRLLNLSDGLLGQGLPRLVLLTTNEEINRLHPALTRPGRCLARVEFTRLTPRDAQAWLPPGHDTPDRDLTLAELYEHLGTTTTMGSRNDDSAPVGLYL